MKNILLLVHDDDGQEARLQVALDLVRGLGGHLRCLDVAVLPQIAGDVYGASAMILEDEREREAVNQGHLEARLAQEDVSWDWANITGGLEHCLAQEAGLADLIVVNGGLNSLVSPDNRRVATQLLHDTQIPVFAVPDGVTSLDLTRHVIVAWDGSDAAGAALRAATPLLALAATVTLLEIGEAANVASVQDAALYLSRHNIRPEVVRIPAHGQDVGERLLGEIHSRAARYVVMGGYGHNRLREALLGGVTRTLLQHSPVPLFLAH